jgi:hypothetical protein
MLKNRIFVLLAAVGIVALALVPASPLATAVAIPVQINAFVAGLILAAVTAGFVWLFGYVGLDLRDFTVPISGALSTFILATLQDWVNLIPAQYDTFVMIAFNVLVVVLSGIGTLYVIARQRGSFWLLADT